MATKPKGIEWGELIDLRNELVDWLVAQGLADEADEPWRAVFKVLNGAENHGSLASAIAKAIYQIETFVAAGRRADRADREAVLRKATDIPERVRTLLTDDSVEREVDRIIRSFKPKLAHVQRRIERIVELQVCRAEAMRMAPDRERIDRSRARVTEALEQLQDDVRKLHRAFVLLSPSMRHEELTLSGCRRFEKRIRRALGAAGYSRTGRAPRA